MKHVQVFIIILCTHIPFLSAIHTELLNTRHIRRLAQSPRRMQHLIRLSGVEKNKALEWIKKFQETESWLEGEWGHYYRVLPELINKHNLKIGCEVGVSTGGHSCAILQNTNVKKLYSVDPYSAELLPSFASAGVLDLYFLYLTFRLNKFGNRSEMVRLYSVPAANIFNDGELDFVFIDADHSYESVKQDLASWYKKVRSGGIIAGDDYATSWPGVPQAVNEFFGKLGLNVNLDKQAPRIWWVQKP